MQPRLEYAPVKIFGDNQGIMALSRRPVQRCKYINIKHHFIKDALHSINIIYCPTADMLADIMTKPPTRAKQKKIQRTFIRIVANPTNMVLSRIYKQKNNITVWGRVKVR